MQRICLIMLTLVKLAAESGSESRDREGFTIHSRRDHVVIFNNKSDLRVTIALDFIVREERKVNV